jgi:rubredoxin
MNDDINYIICPRCKTYAKETDLKDVYKCIGCGLIINERLDDRKEDGKV